MDNAEKQEILIVDDEKSNLDILLHILKDQYVLYVAKSGEDALKKAKANKPDLILLDIVMPEMNGFEVILQLKQDMETRAIPVVFITGLNSVANEEQGFELGAVDYIGKPFNPQVVQARVRTQLKIVRQMRTIEEMGMIDPTTDLPNKKRFKIQFRMEWLRALREKQPLGLVLIEPARLREFLDQTPKVQEEQVLQRIATNLSKSLKRPTDLLARIERSRFGAFLPNTNFTGTLQVAEEMKRIVETMTFPGMGNIDFAPGKINIWVVSTVPELGQNAENFLTQAEKMLETAKST